MRQLATPGADLEAYLARLYSEPEEQERFLVDPRGTALRAGLTAAEADALARIDRTGLTLAGRSFAAKRAGQPARPGLPLRLLRQCRGWLQRL